MYNMSKIKNCLNCTNHKIIDDPDPYDETQKGDKAIVCGITIAHNVIYNTIYESDKQPYRIITTSCKLENLEKEDETPDWCPINRSL